MLSRPINDQLILNCDFVPASCEVGGRVRRNGELTHRLRRHSDLGHGRGRLAIKLAEFGKKVGATAPLGGGGKSRVTMMQTSRTSEPFDLDGDSTAAEVVQTGVNWFSAFWRFTRPHTIIGSVSTTAASEAME